MSQDPLVDLIRLLQPQATRWSQIDANGSWALGFRKRDDLLFCSIAAGKCLLLRPAHPPLTLQTGDFVLIRTSTSFRLASHPKAKVVQSEDVLAPGKNPRLKLGPPAGTPCRILGGRFLFANAAELLLTQLLPSLVHIAKPAAASQRIHDLLKMNASESAIPRPGGAFIIGRLMELVLVEILRDPSYQSLGQSVGLIAGLANPTSATALKAMHDRIAHPWTVAKLARLCGLSRSAFAARFHTVVGVSPIQYLLDWRMTIAREELLRREKSMSEIAFMVGFQSVSAFSTAFRRAAGLSPRAYLQSARKKNL